MKQSRESLQSRNVLHVSWYIMDEEMKAKKVAYNGIKDSFSKIERWRHLEFSESAFFPRIEI